ncbi:MAG: DUF4845 domain-containing protein [Gammaproteobacteria bacterium]|nr:DUF4845 domain-containing protein [Gammaproteobacteria bacterium]
MRTITKDQRGMTAIGWAVVLALIAFFALIVLRLGPIYLEYFSVSSSVDSLADEPNITQMSPYKVRSLLLKRLHINEVDSVSEKDLHIEGGSGSLTVEVDYEVRTRLLGNVDGVVSFRKVLEVNGR